MNKVLFKPARDPQVKNKHIDACLLEESQYFKSAGFDHIELVNQSAAAISFEQISLSTTFLGHGLKAPVMIAPMTGGTELGAKLNQRWAEAAEHFGIALGVGSQRLALENSAVEKSFQVRVYAPTTMIFANLGAAQLVRGMHAQHCLKAVDMVKANALFIHLNPCQEACQQGGDANFSGVLTAIAQVVHELEPLKIPVLVREVGFGLSEQAAKALLETGIAGLDCAGAGGTSWAKVESLCASDESYRRLAWVMGEWGIPTVQSIKNVRQLNSHIPLIACGGIRSGLDVAKALALGANLAAIAQPMLKAAMISSEALHDYIEQILLELKVAMFASGAREIADLLVCEKYTDKYACDIHRE